MTPSPITSSATLDLFSTHKETFLALGRILNGGPFPENVHDINPFQCKPENLPGTSYVFPVTIIHVFNFLSFLEKCGITRTGYDDVHQVSRPLEVLWVEHCNFRFISYNNFHVNSLIFQNWVLSQILVPK